MAALRLQYRLVIPFAIVAVAGASSAAVIALSVASNALRSRVQTQLAAAAEVVSRQDFALNPAILERFHEIIGAQVITYDESGRVVQSTVAGSSKALEEAATKVVRGAAAGSQSQSAWTDCGVPCLVVHRGVQGRPGYVVALVAETSDVTATSRAISRTILLAAAVSVLVMVLVSQATVRRMTRPLQRLVQFARERSPSDVRRLTDIGDDEIGAVAKAFNEMLDRVDQAQSALVRSEKLGLAGMMAARVAHDIRNPLSSIKMQTQLIRARLRGDPEDDAMLMSVLHDIEQVESVIRNLLELARPGELRLERMSVNVIVRDALQQLSAQFAHRKIAVDVHLDGSLPPVALDRSRFKQVLLNVLTNAADALLAGGTITVLSRADRPAAVVIEIRDDGAGIDPAVAERVFDPFVSTKPDGIGLGLVNARSVVELHGGQITLRPRSPRGTSATITLPVDSLEGEQRVENAVHG